MGQTLWAQVGKVRGSVTVSQGGEGPAIKHTVHLKCILNAVFSLKVVLMLGTAAHDSQSAQHYTAHHF